MAVDMIVLRLALFPILMLSPGCLALIGPDCSSWGMPNVGTTLRSALNNAIGYLSRPNVHNGNLTVSRLLGFVWHCRQFFAMQYGVCHAYSACKLLAFRRALP